MPWINNTHLPMIFCALIRIGRYPYHRLNLGDEKNTPTAFSAALPVEMDTPSPCGKARQGHQTARHGRARHGLTVPPPAGPTCGRPLRDVFGSDHKARRLSHPPGAPVWAVTLRRAQLINPPSAIFPKSNTDHRGVSVLKH